MTEEQAEDFVALALAGIDREYPNKPGAVLTGAGELKTPRQMHPVFFGHFDWHSSVHGHWMLVRLVRLFPEAGFSDRVREMLDSRLSAGGLRAEADYFLEPENRSFERMYGWAWALRLALELANWNDVQAQDWSQRFKPLEETLVRLATDYLPKMDWPVRCGFHPESAFPLAQMLDYARGVGDRELDELLIERSLRFYGEDRNYPTRYEPSGNDFFSPGLNEADLMRRVLDRDRFERWLEGFLPRLGEEEAGNLLNPVKISDPSDGHLIHLAGLNLSRSWAMKGIASALSCDDPRVSVLERSAAAHEAAGLAFVRTGHYEGEHWLASFAVYLLGKSGR
ncbi:DUF2891 domain-containing protein [Haloferula helveola]|uniref:DUF2891 domain-containing protein n=1 Tax=Haloferula helveola TaxID=490095 RepID=A0ABN6H7S4_9BACT|nr:DUF2891 domain-containing protein [Haloferula helveola]